MSSSGEEPECRPLSSPIRAAPPAIDHEWRCLNCYCVNPLELESCESCSAHRDASEDCIKQVYFVRHGLSEANVLFYAGQVDQARAILDPPLASEGQNQARETCSDPILARALSEQIGDDSVNLLVISPLRRTIQTATLAFAPWLKQRADAGTPVSVALMPDIQETGSVNGDTGRPASVIEEEFGADYPWLPFESLPELWCIKEGIYEHNGPALAARYDRFCNWLANRPEKNIIVVGHHNVYLGMLGVSFHNCEVRKYRFDGTGRQGDGSFSDSAMPDVPAAVPPLLSTFEAIEPQVSTCDEELSEKDLEWVNSETMKTHNVQKMEMWGFTMPNRFK